MDQRPIVLVEPIVLAHEEPFLIGTVEVRPATREILFNGAAGVVEPRVMQMLVALHRADGRVVSKDDLIGLCWEGRVIGEDAINRVVSRLRHDATEKAGGAFRVETITKVGYRLVNGGKESPQVCAIRDRANGSASNGFDRRGVIVAAGATAALAAAGFWLVAGPPAVELPSEADALIAKGHEAMRQGTLEHVASAVALFRKATQIAPSDARAWGALALAYQGQSLGAKANERLQIEARAQSAADRALKIDPGNVYASIVTVTLQPYFGRWADFESIFRRLLAREPENWILNNFYGAFLGDVGRYTAALPFFDRAMAIDPMYPSLQSLRAGAFWSTGRLDEADAAIDAAAEIWPRNYSVWFVHNRMLTYTGRTKMALAKIANTAARPTGIPDWNFELCYKEARALDTGRKSDIDDGIAAHLEAARKGVGFAEIAVIFASAVGRLDDAFAILMGYYFNRGFQLGELRYTQEQGRFVTQRRRNSWFLFLPPTAPLRADPRFGRLMNEVGLEDYWRRSGTIPDFRAQR